MATGLLYSSIIEKENLSPRALELRVGVGNGIVAKSIKKNSPIKPATLARIAKAFPHLDLKQMEIDLLKEGTQTVEEHPATYNADKPAPVEQAGTTALLDAYKRLADVEREAKEAYKKLSELALKVEADTTARLQQMEISLRDVQETVSAHGSRLVALHATVPEMLSSVLGRLPNDIAGELHRAYLRDREVKKTGTLADSDS